MYHTVCCKWWLVVLLYSYPSTNKHHSLWPHHWARAWSWVHPYMRVHRSLQRRSWVATQWRESSFKYELLLYCRANLSLTYMIFAAPATRIWGIGGTQQHAYKWWYDWTALHCSGWVCICCQPDNHTWNWDTACCKWNLQLLCWKQQHKWQWNCYHHRFRLVVTLIIMITYALHWSIDACVSPPHATDAQASSTATLRFSLNETQQNLALPSEAFFFAFLRTTVICYGTSMHTCMYSLRYRVLPSICFCISYSFLAVLQKV